MCYYYCFCFESEPSLMNLVRLFRVWEVNTGCCWTITIGYLLLLWFVMILFWGCKNEGVLGYKQILLVKNSELMFLSIIFLEYSSYNWCFVNYLTVVMAKPNCLFGVVGWISINSNWSKFKFHFAFQCVIFSTLNLFGDSFNDESQNGPTIHHY